jgi:nickel/cobalt exporter
MVFRPWWDCMALPLGWLAASGSLGPLAAHPHVWIDAVATFVFEDGALVGLRQHWQFDELSARS